MRHGEAAAVDTEALEVDLQSIREALQSYPNEDIYNMDETGLYWKATPDRTLASEEIAGGKKEKARITANFCCNVTGSDKLPIWFIGKAKNPRCFKGIKIKNLDLEWRSNAKAWMTGKIFREWLIWFNKRMTARQVLLLVDGFSAHEAGLNLLEEEGIEIANVKVVFLPTNATSLCQPLDQGIIRAWKAYYRRQWLKFAIQEYEAEQDPDNRMNVLQALRWSMKAWDEDITGTTIANCWLKSRVLGPKYGPQTRIEAEKNGWKEAVKQDDGRINEAINEIQVSIQKLSDSGRIRDAMAISQFINPSDEIIDDEDDEILERVVEAYAEGNERDHETDEEEVNIVSVKTPEALTALSTLRLFAEQREYGDRELIRQLNHFERVVRTHEANGKQQSSITSYFS
jgi:hypothetical protein